MPGRLLPVALMLLLGGVCRADEVLLWKKLPKLGGRVRPANSEAKRICLVSPAQLDPCMNVEVKGVRFQIAYRKRRFGVHRVTSIRTNDPKFVAPSGERVGDLIEVLPSEIIPSPGFEVYAANPKANLHVVVGFNGKVMTADDRFVEVDVVRHQESTKLRIGSFAIF